MLQLLESEITIEEGLRVVLGNFYLGMGMKFPSDRGFEKLGD